MGEFGFLYLFFFIYIESGVSIMERSRLCLTKLGVFRSKESTLDFVVQDRGRFRRDELVLMEGKPSGHSSLFSFHKERLVFSRLCRVIEMIEKNVSTMNRALDIQKLSNLYEQVEKSGVLSKDQKKEIQTRIEAVETIVIQNLSNAQRSTLHKEWESTQYAQLIMQQAVAPSKWVANVVYNTSQPKQVDILSQAIEAFSKEYPDENRAISFLLNLKSRALKGEVVNIPKYYHCTRRNAALSIASTGMIQCKERREMIGARGAWVSTNPQPHCFGTYVFVLSVKTDYLNNSTDKDGKLTTPSRNSSKGINIGLQQNIYISTNFVKSSPLSCIGICDSDPFFDSTKLEIASQFSKELVFTHTNGEEDVAIFKTSTILRMHHFIHQFQNTDIPRYWHD